MAENNKEITAHEVVIVRRRGGDHGDGHHGGVWKIAYADFMTAMMTFFLVMWLVNAADKKTVTQIATYFNPIKLTDKMPSAKGIRDPASDPANPDVKDSDHKGKSDQAPESKAKERAQVKEEILFRDPFGVLQKLADQAAREAAADAPIPAGASRSSGTADPFLADPTSPANDRHTFKSTPRKPDALADPFATSPGSDSNAKANSKVKTEWPTIDDEAEGLAESIRRAMKTIPVQQQPDIEVRTVDEGTLISLTDGSHFEMFAIGSAEPNARLITVMDRLAAIIKDYPGRIIIRGHTDGRQYKNGKHGNWRLSVDRAYMAYFMLVRGAVHEHRFLRIEGNADRALKSSNPDAAENRRIDLLIKKDMP